MKEISIFRPTNPPAPDGRIFHGSEGGMQDHIALNKICQRAAAKTDLGAVHFHRLRHTCASLLIDAGANAKAVQRYMGHGDIQTTLNLYGHLFPDADQALADSMEIRRDEYLKDLKV